MIDTRQFKHLNKQKKPKSHRKKFMFLLVVIIGLILASYFFKYDKKDNVQSNKNNNSNITKTNAPKQLKTFTPDEFNVLATTIQYPNIQKFSEKPAITGDTNADQRIRKIAESRGYVMTALPSSPIVKIDEPRLDGDDLLQPLAAKSWHSLKDSAKKENILLSLVSAYRSPEYQRKLFLSRLKNQKVSVSQVIAGTADEAIKTTLSQAALPGYSRHHTGYTIDLWCEDGSPSFLVSSCFRWISKDNYKNAKLSGWIPSYPEGVKQQGPEPEPWEYVWVGKQLLY